MTQRKYFVWDVCDGRKGGNHACKRGFREGRPAHIISFASGDEPIVVLPTYHYRDADEAIAAFNNAEANAPLIENDEQLYACRQLGVAYRLPTGWIDPSRR